MKIGERYLVVDELTTTDQSRLFLARDLLFDHTVVIKEVVSGQMIQIEREYEVLHGLRHPNLVQAVDLVAEGEQVFLVLTHAPGLDFVSWARRDRTPRRLSEGVAAVLRGLQYIHRRGAVHRDIKPHNIRVAEGPSIGSLPAARIVDFGLATFAAHATSRGAGTPGYLPPEALAGEPATPASDLFSLGAVLHEALTDVPGGYSLDGRKGSASDLSGELAEIVVALLDDDPDARPKPTRLFDALSHVAGRPLQLSPEELAGDYLPRSPLVGRDEELARLDALIERAGGGEAQLMSLEGVGRRAFAAEVAARARLAGFMVFEDAAGPALERELGGAIEAADGYEPLLRRASRLVDRLVSWPRPLLISCDPNLGDDALLEATLDQLARLRAGDAPLGTLLVLLTGGRAGFAPLLLPELSARQVEQQVRELLYHVETIPWIDQARALTGGDPELVTGLVHQQIEAGLPDRAPRELLPAGADPARRLAALDERQRELLACLAFSPTGPVPPEVLAAAVPAELRGELAGLVARSLVKVTPQGVAPRSRALARRAAGSITNEAARALHLRYAEAWSRQEGVAPARLGYHLLRAGQVERAAELLLRADAPRSDLERAVELLPADAPIRPRVVARLARLYRARGDLDRALERVALLASSEQVALLRATLLLDAGQPARALHELDGVDAGSEALLLRARAQVLLGAHEAAAAAAEAGLATPDLTARRRVELQNVAGLAAVYRGRDEEALVGLTRCSAAARALNYPESLARVLNSVGIAHQRLGRLEQAAAAYGEALALFRRLGDLRQAASCALNLGTLAHRRADYEQALEHYRAAAALGQRDAEFGATTIWALANEANLLLLLGDAAGAEERLGRASRLCEEQEGGRSLGGHILLYRADARRLVGENDAARALLARAQRSFEPTDRPGREAAALLRCELDLLRGAADEAAAGCEALLERMAPDAPDRRLACLIGGRAALALAPPQLERADRLLLQAQTLTDGADERAWEIEAALAELWGARGDEARQRQHERRCAEAVAQLRTRVPLQFRASFDARPDLARAPAAPGQAPTPGGDAGLARLLRINEELNAGLPLEQLLKLLLDSAIELTGAERGFVLLRRGARLRLAAARNADREPLRRGAAKYSRSIARQVVNAGEPAVLTDAQEDHDFAGRQSVSELRLRAVLCVPLRAQDETRGALYLDNRYAPGLFGEQTVALAAAFAVQACIALENARLLDEAAHQRTELARAKEAVEALNRRLAAQVARQSQQLSEISVRLDHQEEELVRRYNAAQMIGRSKPMLALFATIDRVAGAEVPVVIHGESGTGKELAARALHQASPRAAESFVALNCGALPTSLIESELFGYARGAFTGAVRDRVGLFEAAGGGTLLLDEIGDMDLEVQVKLLRVLQERTFRRLGDEEERRSRCRIVAASHRDLERLVAQGSFREDLYYRLKVVQLEVPPLRRRREDIPLLADHFLAEERPRRTLSPAALRALINHNWPGNVRQLHNELQRAALLGGEVIELADLSDALRGEAAAGAEPGADEEEPELREALRRHERCLIERALQRAGTNVTAAAAQLGLHRVALHRRMRALGIAGARGRAGSNRRTRR